MKESSASRAHVLIPHGLACALSHQPKSLLFVRVAQRFPSFCLVLDLHLNTTAALRRGRWEYLFAGGNNIRYNVRTWSTHHNGPLRAERKREHKLNRRHASEFGSCKFANAPWLFGCGRETFGQGSMRDLNWTIASARRLLCPVRSTLDKICRGWPSCFVTCRSANVSHLVNSSLPL